MSQTIVEPGTKFVVETSYEAMTMDYLAPHWNVRATFEGEGAKEAAEAELAQAQADGAKDGLRYVAQMRTINPPRPETGYVDEFLEAEFAANAQYWAGQARAAKAQEEARREMFETYGKGKVVKVVKGRKVPLGTEGTVFWLGESNYGGYRVGFKTVMGETHYTALSNVEAIPGMVEVTV